MKKTMTMLLMLMLTSLTALAQQLSGKVMDARGPVEGVTVAEVDKNDRVLNQTTTDGNGIFLLAASLPCVLGYNVWSDLHILGNRDVLDSEDYIVSNLLLPIGSLCFLLFCVTKWGWGFDNYMAEVNEGKGLKFSKGLKFYFQIILPILILFLVWQGLK